MKLTDLCDNCLKKVVQAGALGDVTIDFSSGQANGLKRIPEPVTNHHPLEKRKYLPRGEWSRNFKRLPERFTVQDMQNLFPQQVSKPAAEMKLYEWRHKGSITAEGGGVFKKNVKNIRYRNGKTTPRPWGGADGKERQKEHMRKMLLLSQQKMAEKRLISQAPKL